MKELGIGILVIAGILGLTWVFQGNDFFLYRYFAPKEEAVRRQVFEQSKAYNDGMAQEIQDMQFQYASADASHKKALASIVLHRTAGYDVTKLPAGTEQWVESLRSARETGQ